MILVPQLLLQHALLALPRRMSSTEVSEESTTNQRTLSIGVIHQLLPTRSYTFSLVQLKREKFRLTPISQWESPINKVNQQELFHFYVRR